jgi:hypothetical protein
MTKGLAHWPPVVLRQHMRRVLALMSDRESISSQLLFRFLTKSSVSFRVDLKQVAWAKPLRGEISAD